MDAFETLIASIFDRDGYWTRREVKVELSKEEKREIGRPSTPRWELDVVAYRANENTLHVIECKSYLDSFGVRFDSFSKPESSHWSRFKLFNEPKTREIVFSRLARQFEAQGLCRMSPRMQLCLAAGKIYGNDLSKIREHFDKEGWLLLDPDWVRSKLRRVAEDGYENSAVTVAAKILLRN